MRWKKQRRAKGFSGDVERTGMVERMIPAKPGILPSAEDDDDEEQTSYAMNDEATGEGRRDTAMKVRSKVI